MARRGQLLNIIEGSNTANTSSNNVQQDESTSMSFLKGADRDEGGFIDMRGYSQQTIGGFDREISADNPPDYNEWDAMTARMEENYEITSEARDYNNNDLDDSLSKHPV